MQKNKLIQLAILAISLISIQFIADTYVQNITLIIGILSSIIIGCILDRKNIIEALLLTLIAAGLFVSFTTFYNFLDINNNWSKNHLFNKTIRDIEKTYDVIYETEVTKLYINKETKKLFSISDIGTSKYFYQTNLANAEETEYYLLFDESIDITSKDKDFTNTKIYPSTISNLTSYEHLLETEIDGIKYVAPTFIVGNLKFDSDNYKNLLKLQYQDDPDANYTVFKDEKNILFANNTSLFSSPYANVKYNETDAFKVRYSEFRNKFETFENTNNYITFGLAKSIDVNGINIKKVSFYYEIYNLENEGSLLMEVIYNNGTSDICYVREVYPETFSSVIE